MSKYTTQVRFICETNAKKTLLEMYPDETFSENTEIDGKSVDEIISLARAKVFNFSYPIFDEEYRAEFEKKILRHYYTREICSETVGLWKLWLETRLNDIMPFYNELYKTTVLEFNPLYDVDYTTTSGTENNGTEKGDVSNHHGNDKTTKTFTDRRNVSTKSFDDYKETGTRDYDGYAEDTKQQTDVSITNTGTQTNNATNGTKDLYSDTPQGTITNINLTGNAYLTNARITDGTNDSTRTDNLTQRTSGEFDNNRTHKTIDGTVIDSKEIEGSQTDTTEFNGSEENKTEYASVIEKDITTHSTENYVSHVVGKTSNVSYAKLIAEFRKNILNIDKMVIDELADLFFNLW